MRNINKLLPVIMMLITVFGFSQTVDLNNHVTDAAPAGSNLEWHNAIPLSTSNTMTPAQVSAAGSGSYYAVYYDSVNGCYSPYSKVKVVTNTCPVKTFDLTSLTVSAAPAGTDLEWHTSNIPDSGNLVPTPTTVGAGTYYAVYHDNVNNCYSPVSTPAIVAIDPNCACYKPGVTGNALVSKIGITSLDRTQAQQDNWPAMRKGAWLVLEAKSKGFVPNRVAFNTSGNPIGIAPANFVEGMMVYDTTHKCLKIYTSKDEGQLGWYCISTQTCPDQ